EIYTKAEIERITRLAFESARIRNKKVHLIDKANVLASSILWRDVVDQIAKEYEDIKLEYMYVDNAAMQIIKNPSTFDVMLCSN
ncbi:isocitrate/isopropylmalate family dehydrogenase, partial [Campylobacter jejuni]|nr:isocitrate/isopropylmalate family dehydrogenase [Campylobacter jejuni]